MNPSRFLIAASLGALLAACQTTKAQAKPDQAAVAPVVHEDSAEEYVAHGIAAADANKLADALADFQKAQDKAPQMVAAPYNLGVVYERQGELAKAAQAYETAHKLDAAHEPTLVSLGRVYRLQGKADKAVALYESALKLQGHDHDVELLNHLTVAYRLAKNYAAAEATAKKVLARTKDNPEAYKNLALIYYDEGNYRLAEFISGNARKVDDKDPGVHNNLGMIYLRLDDRPRALAQFQKAVSLDDKFAPGHINIGAMALQYRDYATAEREFAKAVSLDPNAADTHLYYAYALDGQRGREPKKGLQAGAEFEKVLSLRPESKDATCGAGWAFTSDRTGWQKAMGYLEKCKADKATLPKDQQLIDTKLKTLTAMLKTGPAAAPAPKKEAPKATGTGLLDKASDEAAKQEGEAAEPAK